MRTLLIGGTGFLGTHLARALLAAGHEVSALSRRGAGPLAGVRYLAGDAARGQGIEAVRDADAVVYLAGIIREGEQTYEAVHVRGVRRVLEAMATAGVRRIVHVSALGARPDAPSRYHTSKAEGEALVQASRLEWTIFRPSLIFGEGDGFFGGVLRDLVRLPLPFVPLVGGGGYPFRPVWAGDVAAATLQALERPRTAGRRYDLVGPREYRYRELVEAVARALGSRKPLLPLPVAFFAVLARLPGAPLTRDQLLMLLEGNTADPGPLLADFELEHRPLEAELPRILGAR